MSDRINTARTLCERLLAHAEISGGVVDAGVFESAPFAIHVVGAEGLIVEVNRAFEIMFGASRRLYLGKHSAILGADSLAAGVRLLDSIRCAVRPGGVWRGTIRFERFNGATSQARTHVYPMRSGGRTYLVFFQEQIRSAAAAHARVAIRAPGPVLAPAS